MTRSLEIDHLLERRPRQLSGGQRQRVALARAIVREPAVFLMDEPLSNLDAKLRMSTRGEIKRLQKQLGVTTLYVTHDQSEATTMADLVAVMREGDLLQLASPGEIYDRPANRFVATFVGSPPMSVLDGAIDGDDFVVGDARLALPAEIATECRERQAVAIGIRPEDLGPDRTRRARGIAGLGVRGRADGVRDARRRHGRRDARGGAGAARDDLPARRGRGPRRRCAASVLLRRGWHDRRTPTGHRALRLSARGEEDKVEGKQEEQLALSRRRFIQTGLAAGGALSAAGLLAACGGSSGGSSSSAAAGSTAAAASGASSTELKGTGRGDHRRLRGRRAGAIKKVILPLFTQETGIKTQFLLEPYDSFFSKAFQDGTSKSGQFDIYIMDDPWIPQYAAGGVLEPLEQHGLTAEDTYPAPFIDLGFWPPKSGPRVKGFEDQQPTLVALPTIGDLQTLTYRNDVFTNGAPKTYDEFVQIAGDAQKAGKIKYGYVFRGVKGNPIVGSWWPVMQSYGADMFDDKWEPIFNSAEGKASAAFLLQQLKAISPPDVAEYNSDQEGAAILGGDAAAAIQYSGAAIKSDDPAQSKAVGKLDFGVTPAQTKAISQLGIFIHGVSSGAPNKDNAIIFCKWFAQDRIQIELARSGDLPVKRAGFEDQQAVSQHRLLPVALAQLDSGSHAAAAHAGLVGGRADHRHRPERGAREGHRRLRRARPGGEGRQGEARLAGLLLGRWRTSPQSAARPIERVRGAGLEKALPYLFLAPALLLVLAVIAYPLIRGFQISTEFYRFGRPLRSVGLDNYREAWNDKVFRAAVWTTIKYVFFAVLFETVLGLGAGDAVRQGAAVHPRGAARPDHPDDRHAGDRGPRVPAHVRLGRRPADDRLAPPRRPGDRAAVR